MGKVRVVPAVKAGHAERRRLVGFRPRINDAAAIHWKKLSAPGCPGGSKYH